MSYKLQEMPGYFSGLHPVAADAVIQIGGLVAINAAGNAVAAAAAVTGHVTGRADDDVDNTGGAAGDKTITTRRGVFVCANSATHPVDKSHVQKMVFAEAPDIIASEGTCRAGLLIGFDSDGAPIVDVTAAAIQTAADVAAAVAP